MDTLPTLSLDLINYLDKAYPNKTLKRTDINKSERLIWFEAGQRALVDRLLSNLKEEEGDS
jgi:hypothetical protein